MRFLATSALCLTWLLSVHAQHDNWDVTSNSTACGDIFGSEETHFDATDAYNCLVSTPFDRRIAEALLDYWKYTVGFHSTVGLLKNPPRGYQQPSVDLYGGFDLIRNQVDAGVFDNQYSFEAAVHQLLYSAHDAHLQLDGGVVGIFQFGSPRSIVAVSADGFAIPKLYVNDDLVNAQDPDTRYDYSAIDTINGENAERFLKEFGARNTLGALEAHGEWNRLMYSYVDITQGVKDGFRSTVFYPGDKLEIKFDNGTVRDWRWRAYKARDSGSPLVKNGADLYNRFVLGMNTASEVEFESNPTRRTELTVPNLSMSLVPAEMGSRDSRKRDDGNNSNDDDEGWGFAFPDNADVTQTALDAGGVITGYFLTDSRLAVLSIPSFQMDALEPESFSDAISKFLDQALEKKMEKVLIDLRGNGGGTQLLAADTFRHFFPDVDPFSGMRSRATDVMNVLGSTLTSYYIDHGSSLDDDNKTDFINSPWSVSNEIDPETKSYFDSWDQYYGPVSESADKFSKISRYNISSEEFDEAALGIQVYGYGKRPAKRPQPYQPNDIAILSDGTCGSTCDLFVEMMHHEKGVKTIAVGGLPQYGPMQARGGTRGALRYTSGQLDSDFARARLYADSTKNQLPDREKIYGAITSLAFNLRDQVREGEQFPLQLAYEAADCRIFYTFDTVNNYTNLWEYAANAVFHNGSTCVKDSDQHNNTMQTDQWGPSDGQKLSWAASNPANTKQKNHTDYKSLQKIAEEMPLYNSDTRKEFRHGLKRCVDGLSCDSGATCMELDGCVAGKIHSRTLCLYPCNSDSYCGNAMQAKNFLEHSTVETKWSCKASDSSWKYCTPAYTKAEKSCFKKANAVPAEKASRVHKGKNRKPTWNKEAGSATKKFEEKDDMN